MKVVIKRAGQKPEVKEIGDELNDFQEVVGGYIQCVRFPENILCVCNDEGKFMGLLPNFIYNEDLIVGDVFFCSAGEEDFDSLNDKQIKLIMSLFKKLK